MAITVRKTLDEMVQALIYTVNALHDQALTDGYHRDLSQLTTGSLLHQSTITLTTLQVTAAAAVDLPTSIALANNIKAVLDLHFADAQAHFAADPNKTSLDAVPLATDLSSVEALLNAAKTQFNAHLAQIVSNVHIHVNDDTGNSVSTANATDLTSSEALANALKSAINSHIANAATGGKNAPRINVISP